jgi:hypothetical protein
MPSETYMIFVADSNLWVEAQKFGPSGNSHTYSPLFLYSSRPPPYNSVWDAFKKNKFENNIYDRTYGGGEKEVDESMSVDMVVKATELQIEAEFMAKHFNDPKATKKKDRTTFVIIKGNRDIMPAVKHVLRCKIGVALCGWKSGISQVYLDLAATNSLLSVYCWI